MKPIRRPRFIRFSSTKVALVFATFAASLFFSRFAAAELILVKNDDWELFTEGRINAFYSFGFGDSLPVATQAGEHITPGGGLDTDVDIIPRNGPDGMPIVAQGTFRASRIRSGFVPNILGTGLRWHVSEDTTLKVYVALWMTIEAEGQRKFNNPFPFAREGFAKLDGPWGSLLVGRALDLFSRGATENDFLYGHGYALGFPGNVNDVGPTAGLIGFGVLAAFFSPGIVYSTPAKKLLGFQLNVGVYDPVVITGYYPATRGPLLESEATYDFLSDTFKLHLFANGAYQTLYRGASNDSQTMKGVGYGGRIEVGMLHLGVAGHYGTGLGLSYALENSATSITQNGALRTFDGYSALFQLALSRLDINLGGGISRVFLSPEDKMPDPAAPNSLIKTQVGLSGGLVLHVHQRIHLSLDYFRGQFAWYLGEKQNVNFINTGMTVAW